MEMKDLTAEELVKFFKEELHQDITLEEAQNMQKSSGMNANYFKSAKPINLHDLISKSTKENPFVLNFSKELMAKKELLDIMVTTLNETALKALENGDCKAVFIAYVRE